MLEVKNGSVEKTEKHFNLESLLKDLTPEEISLAVLAMKESAACARLAAIRMRCTGDKLAAAYEAKASNMEAAAARFSLALPA